MSEEAQVVAIFVAALAVIVFAVVGVVFVVTRFEKILGLLRRARAADFRRLVLVVTLLVVGWVGVHPPWVFTFTRPGAPVVTKPAPRASLFSPPEPEHGYGTKPSVWNGVVVDFSRLAVEWFVAALGGSLFLLLPRRKAPKQEAAPVDTLKADFLDSTPPGQRRFTRALLAAGAEHFVAYFGFLLESTQIVVEEVREKHGRGLARRIEEIRDRYVKTQFRATVARMRQDAQKGGDAEVLAEVADEVEKYLGLGRPGKSSVEASKVN